MRLIEFLASVQACLLVVAVSAAAWAQPETTTPEQRAIAVLQQAANIDDDLPQVERLARTVIAEPDFRRFAPNTRQFANRLLAFALVHQRRCQEAAPVLDALIADPGSSHGEDGWDFRMSFSAAAQCHDDARANAALIALMSVPNGLDALDPWTVASYAGRSRNLTLLTFLVGGAWTPNEPTFDLSSLRLALVRAYIAHHDIERAREAAQALVLNSSSDLGSIVLLFSEKEFDPVIAADPQTFDVNAILDWQLRNVQAAANGAPDKLELLNNLIEALYYRNRLDEALAMADAALLRASAASADQPAFVDAADQLNWTHDLRARIREAKGDTDEALAAYQQGAEAGEAGESDNISQRLNRAATLVAIGRAADAVRELENVNMTNASPYGGMVLRRVRVCAYAQVGDAAHTREALADAEAHADGSLFQMHVAALCANDLDLAARTYIRELSDPDSRRMAIIGLQTFLGDDDNPTDYSRMLHERGQAMRARADVRRAMDRVTHVGSFPIREPY